MVTNYFFIIILFYFVLFYFYFFMCVCACVCVCVISYLMNIDPKHLQILDSSPMHCISGG